MGEWTEKADEEGKVFYVNNNTGESVWEKPSVFGVLQVRASLARLPRTARPPLRVHASAVSFNSRPQQRL
jgi:hypothetical protein